MRYSWLTLAGLLLAASPSLAQQPTPAADPTQKRLDFLLGRWEQEMSNVKTLAAQCSRVTVDQTFQTTDIFEGTARYMKPNLAMLEMQKKGQAQVIEKYICTGTFLYEFVPQNKVIRVHEMPAPKQGQVADDSFLSFLFGMKAEEARRRYDLKLVKEDQYYVYIEILPRFPADKADFQKARLVLNNQSFLPRQLWFKQPNDNEVQWDIPKIVSGAALNRNDFTQPQTPPGWSMVRVPRSADAKPQGNVPPRIVRPNQ
jgi:TIGR03009 family protein